MVFRSYPLIREARRIVDSAGRDFDKEWKRLETEHSTDYFTLVALANFFEDMAILEKEGQITFQQVIDRFGATISHYHGILNNFIAEKQKDDPAVLENFDRLAKRLADETRVKATS